MMLHILALVSLRNLCEERQVFNRLKPFLFEQYRLVKKFSFLFA